MHLCHRLIALCNLVGPHRQMDVTNPITLNAEIGGNNGIHGLTDIVHGSVSTSTASHAASVKNQY